MSNEKINEAQVEQATSQENENAAANVTPSTENQNVEDIIAERDALKMKVDELEAELRMTSVTMYRVCELWATAIRTFCLPSLSALAGRIVSDSVAMIEIF